MNILYGVQATGNGHISRSREIIRCLKERGHNIHVILSGRKPEMLWDMEIFEPYNVFRGMTFSTHKGKVQYLKTALNLNLFELNRDIKSFNTQIYDLVITDFEPISSRIAIGYYIPSIGIGHQYAFFYDIPVAGNNPMTNFIIKNFAPAQFPVGLHWHHFNQPILPPVVPLFKDLIKTIEKKIIVYLPFEDRKDIIALVKPFTEFQFFVYHRFDNPGIEGNIRLCPYSRQGFLKDLLECDGVITNAGFELVSEALHLGKKLLIKPLSGQMEQLSNALVIGNLHLGIVMNKLERTSVEQFLNSPRINPLNYPNVAGITEYIEKGEWNNMAASFKKSWKDINLI